VWVVLVLTAGRTFAILSEQPAPALYSVSTRAIVPSGPGGGEQAGVASHLPNGSGGKDAAVPNADRAWQQFVGRTETRRGWFVQWNQITGAPHLVAGRPLALPGAQELTPKNIGPVALDFAAANKELLKVGAEDLEVVDAVKAGGRWFVSLRQMHRGVPVLGSQFNMSFTRDNRLIMFSCDLYPGVTVQTEPKVDAKQAIRLACADCREAPGSDRVSDGQLCILPLTRPKGFEYRLCWKLQISQPEIHKKWEYLIDAEAGRILSKSNVLVYQNVTGTAQLEYKPEFAADPTQTAPFPYGNVTARGLEVVLASWNFDSDPGWNADGQWAFGQPNGRDEDYCTDPNSAYTGDNVYGYNLQGEYPNDIQPQYLTTPAIDCSGYENVHLKFVRWLSVESSNWDNASLEVSNDGNSWATIWANGISRMCDDFWTQLSYDISGVAALQPAVYIRWVMGPTDESVTYGGWNIDDVQVVSYLGGGNTTQTQPTGSYSVLPPWNPCAVTSELAGRYCNITYDCNADASFEQPGVEPGQVVNFLWNSDWYNEIVEPSVYWHTNRAHDYFVGMDPGLREPSAYYPSGLDYAMPVRVQAGCPYGYCGAYWDSMGMTFGAGNGWYCDDFGLYSDVIYHEYTHASTSIIYAGVLFPYFMESGAMNEAWSDYFACVLSPSQEPLVGDGGLLVDYPDGFRTLDNSYRRETDFSNSVHFDSQMLSAPLWEIRQNIDPQVPPELWDEVVHFVRYAHTQTFEEYLLALLIEDDTRFGDSYLANGAPHAETIYTAFGNHGIGGLQYVAPSIVIDDAGANNNGSLEPGETVSLSVSLINGWADATDISAALESSDPFVALTKAQAQFPSAEYGSITDNHDDPFVISLDPLCPRTHTIEFTLRLTAAGPYDYSRTCLFTCPVAFAQSAYDDGQVDNTYVGYGMPDGALAVRMTPNTYPSYPMQLRLFPRPDEDATIITITLWDDDGPDGLPGTILGSLPTEVRTGGGWLDVDISSLDLRIDSGSFYAGWVEGDSHYYNGIDSDPPYHERSWVYFDIRDDYKYWATFREVGFLANLMLRVRYFYTSKDGPVENRTKGRRYDFIQYAIHDAEPGDEIVLHAGLYGENINPHGKNLTIRSTDPEDPAVVAATVIDGGYRGPAVTFDSAEDSTCTLTGLTITGGIKNVENDGGISCLRLAQAGPSIRNCIITKNRGPGIYTNDSSPTIVNCTIVENESDGIELRSTSRPEILNSIIARNHGHGLSGAYPTITNCTVVQNTRLGIYHSSAIVLNSIIRDNADGEIDRRAQATYSNIKGGWPGLGNIDADPCFVDPDTGDYHLKSQAGRWRPDHQDWVYDPVTSLCIDAGNPGSPLRNEPAHPGNKRINIGRYGGTAQASKTPARWSLLADLTNDGAVDLDDLAHWPLNWLSSEPDRPADLDRNSLVNMTDFALLAEDWLAETIWHE